MLHLGERAIRALVVPALGNHVPAMNGVQDLFVAAAALTGLRIGKALAHVADATVTA